MTVSLVDRESQILVLKRRRVSIEIDCRKQVESLQLDAAREISMINLEIDSLEVKRRECSCDEA